MSLREFAQWPKYEDENKKSCFRPKKAELVLNKYKVI